MYKLGKEFDLEPASARFSPPSLFTADPSPLTYGVGNATLHLDCGDTYSTGLFRNERSFWLFLTCCFVAGAAAELQQANSEAPGAMMYGHCPVRVSSL